MNHPTTDSTTNSTHRSLSVGGAVGAAGLLAFLIAQCGAAAPDDRLDTASPASAPTTVVATTIEATVTTTEVSPTTRPEVTSPSTTRPPERATTTAVPDTTAAPTTLTPTTLAPTTLTPTTATPTTAAEITATPTTPAAPVTAAPTTATPTTAAPTTAAPTSATPTTAAPTTAAPTTAAPAPRPVGTASPDAVALTNQHRQAAALPALSTDPALTAAAAQHSADQAGRNSMGHTGSDGSSAGDRALANGASLRTWGENVAAGYGSAGGVVDGWMNSPGHRANILNPAFTRVGVAVATAADGTPYWTMVLAG